MYLPSIGLVFDASCDLPADVWRTTPSLHVMPLQVLVGDDRLVDRRACGKEANQFRQRLNADNPASTLPLCVGASARWFAEDVAIRHDNVLALFGSTGREDMLTISRSAAQSASEQTQEARRLAGRTDQLVFVCGDAENALAGYALQALDLISHRRAGHSWEVLQTRMSVMQRKTRSLLVPGDVAYLRKSHAQIGGAHVSAWAEFLSRTTGRTPILGLHRNRHDVLDWRMGGELARARAYDRVCSDIERGYLVSPNVLVSTNLPQELIRTEVGYIRLRAAAARAKVLVHLSGMGVSTATLAGKDAFSIGFASDANIW